MTLMILSPVLAFQIKKITVKYSFRPNHLSASFVSLMGNGVIKKTEMHQEPIIVWTLNIEMEGSGMVHIKDEVCLVKMSVEYIIYLCLPFSYS